MSYKIKNIALTALNQGKLGEFHKATYELTVKTGFNEAITAVATSYQTLCATYADLVKGSYGSGFTPVMTRLDAARDNLFGVVRTCLGYMSKNQNPEIQAYYTEKVVPLLNLYKGNITAESYSEETLHVRSFLNDLKALNAEKLAAAYVTEAMITELETLNDDFEAAYVNRTHERSLTSTDEIRQTGIRLNELYGIICAHALVLATTDVTEENRTKVEAAQTFIGTLNEHIDYQYRYYIGGNSATGGTEDEGSGSGENQSDQNSQNSQSTQNSQNSQSNQNSQSTQNSENSNSGSGSNSGDDDGDENYML